MPELPEVEAARRQLSRWLIKGTLVEVRVKDDRVLRGASSRGLTRALEGRVVRAVERRGKWLRIALGDGSLLFSHLGMTGKWVLRARDAPHEASARVELCVVKAKKSYRVAYLDPRLFGRLVVARADIPEWLSLGPDPLRDGIDAPSLYASLHVVRRTVKEALLDQTLLAGVGNIHAIEALWRARIDPRARTDALTRGEVRALARGLAGTLADGVARYEGREIRYVEEPGAPNPFAIYGRAGEPCPRCKRPLTRVVQGGRGTVFCAQCQRPRARLTAR